MPAMEKSSKWANRRDYNFPWAHKNVSGVHRPKNLLAPFYLLGAIMRTIAVLPLFLMLKLIFLVLAIIVWPLEKWDQLKGRTKD